MFSKNISNFSLLNNILFHIYVYLKQMRNLWSGKLYIIKQKTGKPGKIKKEKERDRISN